MRDYHVHTKLCRHAVGEMEEYAMSAVRQGLSAMGFSDHLPFAESHMKDLSMTEEELELYLRTIPELADRMKIKIYAGIEADYFPGRQDEISALLKKFSFDYVYGSVHYINGWGFDNPQFLTDWEKHDINLVYNAYYQNLVEMAHTGLYDIVAHFDLVKKFSYLPTRPFDEEINQALSAIHEEGMIIEVNTSGLRKPVHEIYPSEFILKAARSYDIPVVLGSDAHSPSDVARDFDKAKDLLKRAGYTETAVIEKREIIGWDELE